MNHSKQSLIFVLGVLAVLLLVSGCKKKKTPLPPPPPAKAPNRNTFRQPDLHSGRPVRHADLEHGERH